MGWAKKTILLHKVMMQKKTRIKIYKALTVCAIIGILGFLIIQLRAKTMVANFIEAKIPPHLNVSYENLTVNIFTGTVDFDEVFVELSNRDSTLIHTDIKSEHLLVKGIQYGQFFFNNTLEARMIKLSQPEMIYHRHLKLPRKDTISQGVVNLLKTIKVDEISINNGSFVIFGQAEDSIELSTKNINFTLFDAKTDPNIIKQKMPIEYGDYTFSADSIFVDLGKFEKLNVGNLRVEKETISITELQLHSKYSKSELSKIARTERDYIALHVPKIEITDIDFGFEKNRFFISTAELGIASPNLEIYRDKLVPDDNTPKVFYSRLIRELPINLDIPEIRLDNGKVTYEELVDSDTAPGKLELEHISGTIANVSNDEKNSDPTQIDIKANLMGEAQVNLKYNFQVGDTKDSFTASGTIFNFKSASANSFLRPNLRAQAEGFIVQLYFTIEGDSKSSRGDMKMKYHDFKFKVLDKNLLKVNKLLTAIGNIFVNDGSKTDLEGFRHGKIAVERDPSKSFFNYLWLNIKSGILSTITGKANKND